MPDELSPFYPQPLMFERAPRTPAEEAGERDGRWEPTIAKPGEFLRAALEERRRELNDGDYLPIRPVYDRRGGPRPCHVFDEVYTELSGFVEQHAPRNLRVLLDPRHWNHAALAAAGRSQPRLVINAFLTARGHLAAEFAIWKEGETSDFVPVIWPMSSHGKQPERILTVRGFDDLLRLAIRAEAGERYLRSAKLLALGGASYVEWMIGCCEPSLEVVRYRAMYVVFAEGPDEEKELAGVEFKSVEWLARESHAVGGPDRAEAERWRQSLPDEWGFTAEAAVRAFQRAGGVYKRALLLLLKERRGGKALDYDHCRQIIKRLQRDFPEMFDRPA